MTNPAIRQNCTSAFTSFCSPPSIPIFQTTVLSPGSNYQFSYKQASENRVHTIPYFIGNAIVSAFAILYTAATIFVHRVCLFVHNPYRYNCKDLNIFTNIFQNYMNIAHQIYHCKDNMNITPQIKPS